MNDNDTLARQRFFVISLLRLGGAIVVAAGLLIVAGKLGLPKALGIPITLLGLADFMFVPWWLAKRWKSPEQ